MTKISILSKISDVYVVIKIVPFYQGLQSRRFEAKRLNIPKKIMMKLPFVLDSDNFTSKENFINKMINNEINYIVKYIRAEAREKKLQVPDEIDFQIEFLSSKMPSKLKELIQNEEIAQWQPMSL